MVGSEHRENNFHNLAIISEIHLRRGQLMGDRPLKGKRNRD